MPTAHPGASMGAIKQTKNSACAGRQVLCDTYTIVLHQTIIIQVRNFTRLLALIMRFLGFLVMYYTKGV